MDLFQPYMQLRFMSNAPIWTKKTTEHIHKGNGVGAVRVTQPYATNGIIQGQLIISFFLYPIGRSITALYISNPDLIL